MTDLELIGLRSVVKDALNKIEDKMSRYEHDAERARVDYNDHKEVQPNYAEARYREYQVFRGRIQGLDDARTEVRKVLTVLEGK